MNGLNDVSKRVFRFFKAGKILCHCSSRAIVVGAGLVTLAFDQSLLSPVIAFPGSPELSRQSFVADAVARSGPAVVTVETQRRVRSRANSRLPPHMLIDPSFRFFFGLQGMNSPRSRIERGHGSGVIFDDQGLVLTNAHVVENMDQLMVGLADGRRVSGRVVGQDSLTDLAVIRLDGSGPWPIAALGDSDKLRVGDWAIAVGNPYGLENTVTMGIVSNLNRNVSQLGISGKRLDLIQTDAAINPGNSGGPLLNAEGEVIGINTLVRSGPGAGLGFAIPINQARSIANQLVSRGWASHPVIGIGLSKVSAGRPGLESPSGAKISYVVPGGPAANGGIQVGDVIVSVGRRLMAGPADVITAINSHGVGRPLSFGLTRGARRYELYITPIEMSSMRGL